MNNKKGSKIFGLIVKVLGKKSSKEALRRQAIRALDTDKDGDIDLDDFANGKWKDISFWKLAIAVALLGGLVWFGAEAGPDVLQFLIYGEAGH